jgi:hypothetical protein
MKLEDCTDFKLEVGRWKLEDCSEFQNNTLTINYQLSTTN